ncbi:MAG: AraC family transcriptional regulator [Prevotella sp.]|nr:AraC family transcriptional regulator [Prevotella sp.]
MLSTVEKIQQVFIRRFTLLMIVESIIRFIICLSFTEKLYAFILAGISVTFVVFYIFSAKGLLKPFHNIILILSLYFLSHYFYVMGAYKFIPITVFWFLIIPMALRIYFSNKIWILSLLPVAASIIFIPQVSAFVGIPSQYKMIILDNYELPTVEFIVNFFIAVIVLYIVFTAYYLWKVLIIQNPKLKMYYNLLRKLKKADQDSIFEEDSKDNQSIRDARLLGVYELIIHYIESSKCYLDSDYTLEQLASELKIHKNTVSISLSHIGQISFKGLLNKYRINAAKDLFDNDKFRENNIKQIYMGVGFKHNTTFNRVFKQSEGITPSEYIISLAKKKMNTM